MKKILYITILLFGLVSHAQQIQWQKNFGGKHAEFLYDAMPTLDYGFIMVGGTLSDNTGDTGKNNGGFDFFITKITEFGNLEWTATFGGNKNDLIKSITNTYDGGYLIAGITDSDIKINQKNSKIGMQDIWLVKINIEGEIEWQKTMGGLANDYVNNVIRAKDGGFIIAATSAGNGSYYSKKLTENKNCILKKGINKGDLDYWLVKIDAFGNEKWQKSIGSIYKDQLKSVIELPNEDIIIAGSSNSPMEADKSTLNKGLTDWWVLKLNKQGEILWQKSFGDEGDDQLFSMIRTKDNNILLGGIFREFPAKAKPNSDFILKKIDTNGNIIWENSYSQGTNDILTGIIQNPDSTFLISGYTASIKPVIANKSFKTTHKKGTEDFLMIKTDKNGNEIWRKNIGTDKKEVLIKSILTRDGGYVLMGTSMPLNNKGNNNANFYIVKILDKDKPLQKKYQIEAIPNPTPDYTQIVIGAEYKEATVTVADLSGKVLQYFIVKNKRIIPVNLIKYANGVYIISVKTDNITNSVKVVKIKE